MSSGEKAAAKAAKKMRHLLERVFDPNARQLIQGILMSLADHESRIVEIEDDVDDLFDEDSDDDPDEGGPEEDAPGPTLAYGPGSVPPAAGDGGQMDGGVSPGVPAQESN